MAGLREQKKIETRAAILNAALQLFTRQGYEKTSISQLAQSAGVGKGTVYGYFQTKSEIFLTFCEQQLSFVNKALKASSNSDTPLLDGLLTLFMNEFRFIQKNKEFGRTLLRETVFPKELTVEQSKEIDNKYIELMLPMFKAAQQRDELRTDIELIFLVGHFYGLYIMTISGWYMGRLLEEEDVADAMESLFRQALQGLSPSPTKRGRLE